MSLCKLMTGLPAELLPAPSRRADRYEIVTDGERNLETRPFDFRNPFALKPLSVLNSDQHNGSNTAANRMPEDADGPFDYYLNGQAAIGLPGGPECALIDIYGTLRAFTGAWGFAIGSDYQAPQLRQRTVTEGEMPEVTAACRRDGMLYRFSYFASPCLEPNSVVYPVEFNGSYEWIGGMHPGGPNMFTVIETEVVNESARSRSVRLTTAFKQSASLCAGAHWKKGVLAPPWEQVELNIVAPSIYRLEAHYNRDAYTLGLLRVHNCNVLPSLARFGHWPPSYERAAGFTAECAGEVIGELAPGASLSLEWIIPYFPMAADREGHMRNWSCTNLRKAAVAKWRERRSGRMVISIPEPKVQRAFDQATNHLDMCCVTLDSTQFPTPGPSGGYHRFFEQDGSDQIHAYDIMGDHARAEAMMRHYMFFDLDQSSCGMILRLYGKHLALTDDMPWARTIFNDVCRRVSWLMSSWAKSRDTDGGLLPVSELDDNERIVGHFVSYHLYSLAGIRGAIAIASALDEHELTRQWQEFHDALHDAVFARLERLVAQTDGVITPGFDGFEQETVKIRVVDEAGERTVPCSGSYGKSGGIDWHNLGIVFPTESLEPHHPWVTSSLTRWRHSYVEGLIPYPRQGEFWMLHNYNTINLSEAWLRRGDQEEALRDLYGVLLHTTATHAASEVVDSSGRRDLSSTPHNWFSAKLVRFVRDMLVYEGHDGRLHLLGCLSPAWMVPGMRVAISDAPTEFGSVCLESTMIKGGMDVTIQFRGEKRPGGAILHVPPFASGVTADCGGRMLPTTADGIELPLASKIDVRVRWSDSVLPDVSFERVAASFVRDYEVRRSRL